MEFLGTFILWGSAIWFWIISLTWIIILGFSEKDANGWWGLGATVIFAIILYSGNSNIEISFITWENVIMYVAIGFVYSLFRTFLFGRKTRKKIKKEGIEKYNGYELSTTGSLEWELERKKDELKENFFRWWFMFPISLLYWIFSDLFVDLYNSIYSRIKGVINAIFDFGVGKFKERDQEDSTISEKPKEGE